MILQTIFLNYWNYLNRHPKLSSNDENLFTSNPQLIKQSFLWSIVFSVIYLSTLYISKHLYPSWYQSLSNKKKGEVPSYALALSHHLIIVPISIYYLYSDYQLSYASTTNDTEGIHYFQKYSIILPFTFGYFIADTFLYTVPELLAGRVAYFIHHVFAVCLLYSVGNASEPCVRSLPHFLLMELSSIFFSAAWLLRQIGLRGSGLVTIFEQLFVFFYFILRIIHMPILLFSLKDFVHTLGPFQYCLIGVMFLQIYWFYQIIQTLRVRDMGGGAGAGAGEGQKKKDK